MKKIILILAILSMAVLSAQSGGCGKKSPDCSKSCSKSKTAVTVPGDQSTTDAEAKVLCPAVAAGETCAHPEKCSYSHTTTDVKSTESASCDKCTGHSKSWWKFWGKSCSSCETSKG